MEQLFAAIGRARPCFEAAKRLYRPAGGAASDWGRAAILRFPMQKRLSERGCAICFSPPGAAGGVRALCAGARPDFPKRASAKGRTPSRCLSKCKPPRKTCTGAKESVGGVLFIRTMQAADFPQKRPLSDFKQTEKKPFSCFVTTRRPDRPSAFRSRRKARRAPRRAR